VSPFRHSFFRNCCVSARSSSDSRSHYPRSCSTLHGSQVTSHKSRLFISLQPLCRFQKSQLLCNQANPASFAKTPGVGGIPGNLLWRLYPRAPRSITPFGINTCKSATKQKTLSTCRINTYAKTREGYKDLHSKTRLSRSTRSRLDPRSFTQKRTTSPPARHSSLATRLPRALSAKGYFPVSFRLPLYPQAIAPGGAARHHWQDAPNRFSGAARLSTGQV
jgi:hypothetical protein